MGSTVESKPVTSLNPACVIPWISTRKRKLRNGSFLAIFALSLLPLSFRHAASTRKLRQTENYELGGLHHRHADDYDQPAIVDVVLCHGGAVHLYEERFVLFGAHQNACEPLRDQDLREGLLDPRPQPFIVVLENHPLRPLVDRLAQEEEEAPHVDIFPKRVLGASARTPHTQTA